MGEQLSFVSLPCQPHRDTSMEAAEMEKTSAPAHRERVLRFLKNRRRYGATDEEIQTGVKMNPSTERPRRGELVDAKLVIDSGERRTTRSGRKAIVWVVVDVMREEVH